MLQYDEDKAELIAKWNKAMKQLLKAERKWKAAREHERIRCLMAFGLTEEEAKGV